MIKDLANGVVVPVDEQLNTLLEKLEPDSELQQFSRLRVLLKLLSPSPEKLFSRLQPKPFKLNFLA